MREANLLFTLLLPNSYVPRPWKSHAKYSRDRKRSIVTNRASLHISPIAAFEIRGRLEARASLSAGRRKSAVACDKQLRPTPTPKSRTFYCLIGNRRRGGGRLSLQFGFVPKV